MMQMILMIKIKLSSNENCDDDDNDHLDHDDRIYFKNGILNVLLTLFKTICIQIIFQKSVVLAVELQFCFSLIFICWFYCMAGLHRAGIYIAQKFLASPFFHAQKYPNLPFFPLAPSPL